MGRTALFSRQQPGGVFTIEDLKDHPGDIYFVDSGHAAATDSAGSGKSPDTPLATLDYAFGLCTASQGDVIYVMPGHAETTTAMAWDVAGVKVVGLGFGRNRPTFTATTAATDLINVTAANGILENVRLVGAASGNTALLDGSSAATDFVARNVSFEQAATPLSGVTWSGTRFTFEDCDFSGSANGPDVSIELEAHLTGWRVSRCRFLYPSGLDVAIIRSANDAQEGYLIEDVQVVGIDTLLVSFASSTAGPPDGLFASGTVMCSAAVTSIEDIVAGATSLGMAFGRVYATDATAKASALIPLTTAS